MPDVPGNPYSPEALQRRLSQGLIRDTDIARLVNASPSADADVPAPADQPTPSASPVSKPDMSRYKDMIGLISSASLTCMFHLFLRYGRDYYINDAKHATGKTPDVTDDWQPITASTPTTNNSSVSEQSNRHPTSTNYQNMYHERLTAFHATDFNNNSRSPTNVGGFHMAQRTMSMRSLRKNDALESSQHNTSTWSMRSDRSDRSDRSVRSNLSNRSERTVLGNRLSWQNGGQLSTARATSEFEADTLRGNLRRDSLCSRDGTDNFVLNPLYVDD